MQLFALATIAFGLWTALVTEGAPSSSPDPPCRFSPNYAIADIVRNPEQFEQDVLFWEGKFHQLNVSLNTYNGMTYDGTLLDPINGTRTAKHPFSAASKEVCSIFLA